MIISDNVTLVAHADWSANARKRWMAHAVLSENGSFTAFAPERAAHPESLLKRLRGKTSPTGCIFLGFDFPIGLPLVYTRRAGITSFLEYLPRFGQGVWQEFYQVADDPEQISLFRPFYPNRPGGRRYQDLLDGLEVDSMDDLRRKCELAHPGRRAASPLFWTLGGQQVGKAAIAGWQSVLAPGLLDKTLDLYIWPFSGRLHELLKLGRIVAVETYPGEIYAHLGVRFAPHRPGQKSGKRVQSDRAMNAQTLLAWASENRIELDLPLQAAIRNGFGPSPGGEDPFDSMIGLFGMLNVLIGNRPPGEPGAEDLRKVEGWILGQGP
jgi:hypothetical protein